MYKGREISKNLNINICHCIDIGYKVFTFVDFSEHKKKNTVYFNGQFLSEKKESYSLIQLTSKMKTNFIISDITYQRIINLHNVEHIHVY